MQHLRHLGDLVIYATALLFLRGELATLCHLIALGYLFIWFARTSVMRELGVVLRMAGILYTTFVFAGLAFFAQTGPYT